MVVVRSKRSRPRTQREAKRSGRGFVVQIVQPRVIVRLVVVKKTFFESSTDAPPSTSGYWDSVKLASGSNVYDYDRVGHSFVHTRANPLTSDQVLNGSHQLFLKVA